MSFHTTQSIIESAIENKQCLVIKYASALRLIEPIALGSGSAKTPADRLTSRQISDNPNMAGVRTFLLSSIEDVQPTDRVVSADAIDYASRVSMVNVVKKLK